jgi:hypothetical protein
MDSIDEILTRAVEPGEFEPGEFERGQVAASQDLVRGDREA